MSLKDKIMEFANNLKEEALGREARRKKLINEITENDEIANKTDWTPCKRGGANFKTATLKQKNNGTLVITASIGMYLFISFVVFMFTVFITAVVINIIGVNYFFIPVLVGIGLAIMIFKFLKPKYFDACMEKYYIGEYLKSEYVIDFTEIYAIQIIKERCSSKNGSYYSYEINIVLNTSERYNVMDHGNLKKIKEDAQTIAYYLGVKLWDLSDV